MKTEYVVVNVSRFTAGQVAQSVMSRPIQDYKAAEVEAAWLEHDRKAWGTTKVVPKRLTEK